MFALVPILNSAFYALNSSYYARWYYMPVLVLAGQCDMVRTQHTCWIAQNIPGSKLCFVPKAGHGDYIVHSPRVYHYIKDFLRP